MQVMQLQNSFKIPERRSTLMYVVGDFSVVYTASNAVLLFVVISLQQKRSSHVSVVTGLLFCSEERVISVPLTFRGSGRPGQEDQLTP